MIPIHVKKAIFCNLFIAATAWTAAASDADYYHVRGGIPNSQHFFENDRVGNQYLFFIGNDVLAGTDLKDKGLRYSAPMVKGFKKFFPEASMRETRHIQPGGSWFGLFRCSRGQAVFGEVICSGHLAILDFAADDRNADIEQVKTSLEGLVRQITLYRATHSKILVYTFTREIDTTTDNFRYNMQKVSAPSVSLVIRTVMAPYNCTFQAKAVPLTTQWTSTG